MPLESLQLEDGTYALDHVTDHLIGHLPSLENQWDTLRETLSTLSKYDQNSYFRILGYMLDSNPPDENRIADIRNQFYLPEDQSGISKETKINVFKIFERITPRQVTPSG
jgi:hypothetical protein